MFNCTQNGGGGKPFAAGVLAVQRIWFLMTRDDDEKHGRQPGFGRMAGSGQLWAARLTAPGPSANYRG